MMARPQAAAGMQQLHKNHPKAAQHHQQQKKSAMVPKKSAKKTASARPKPMDFVPSHQAGRFEEDIFASGYPYRQPAAFGDFYDADYLPVQEASLASTVFPGAALGGVYGGFGLQRGASAALAEDVAWDLDGFYGGLGGLGGYRSFACDFAYDPLTHTAYANLGGIGGFGLDF